MKLRPCDSNIDYLFPVWKKLDFYFLAKGNLELASWGDTDHLSCE